MSKAQFPAVHHVRSHPPSSRTMSALYFGYNRVSVGVKAADVRHGVLVKRARLLSRCVVRWWRALFDEIEVPGSSENLPLGTE